MTRSCFAALSLLASVLTMATGCSDGQKVDPRDKFMTAAKCETDAKCAKGFVCTDGTCQKGERSQAEIEAKQKQERADRAAAEAAKKVTKAGEGQLEVRICPVFKNTPEAIGTIVAKHVESGKESYIHMAREVTDGGWQDVFTFWSLPLGTYEVTASYGIQVRGRAEVVKLKCHDKVKKADCKDEVGLLKTVVLPKDMPEKKKDKEGKEEKIPCDWIVE